MAESIHIRYSLLPFLYTEARRSFDTGVAMLYPTYYDYPYDSEAYAFKTEGFLGPNCLIAPVTIPVSQGNLVAAKQVYLPGDSEWIEWSSLTALKSGIHERVFAIDEIPIYVRAGSIIPMMYMDAGIQNLQAASEDPLILTIFPGTQSASSTYRLYEDDGTSTDYKAANQHAWTQIDSFPIANAKVKQWNVVVHPQQGTFVGMKDTRSYLVRLVGMPKPARIFVGGKELSFTPKRVYSDAHRSFLHWSMSRDASHSFMGSEEPRSGWFYDYEHFAIVIKTDSLLRSEECSVVVEWDESVSERWEGLVSELHGGWIGLLNAAYRASLYSNNSINQWMEDCSSLPKNLQNAAPENCEEILESFRVDFDTLASTAATLPAKAADESSANLLNMISHHLQTKAQQ